MGTPVYGQRLAESDEWRLAFADAERQPEEVLETECVFALIMRQRGGDILR
jgi:hypothetical protein